MEGGGFATRGALFPGVPFVVIGRGIDDVWSATSSQADNTDVFVETLCGDDTHYMYKGTCRAMTTFDAGVLSASGAADEPVVFRETVHGPVQGYATVGGTRVAVSLERSTRGRELLSAQSFYSWDTNQVELGEELREGDGRGRVLVGLALVSAVNPVDGVILNWNNKPAAGLDGRPTTSWAYGSVQRVPSCLERRGRSWRADRPHAGVGGGGDEPGRDRGPAQRRRSCAAISGRCSTAAPAPSPREQQMLDLVEQWRAERLEPARPRPRRGVDDPGAAIMDAVWDRWADAVMTPVLGPALVARLAALHIRSDDANPGGSSYIDGWYGYVDKDLRALLGEARSQGRSRRTSAAQGDLAACRASLWARARGRPATSSPRAAGHPTRPTWRANANAERIRFTRAILPLTMRWTNRPTFQQVVTFSGHRPREWPARRRATRLSMSFG